MCRTTMFSYTQISHGVLVLAIVATYLYTYFFSAHLTAGIMANSGMLFVSNITKVHNFFANASQYVKKILYINVNAINEGSITQQIVNVYSKATSQCNNLDVRLILKPAALLREINTKHPIDLILYDTTLSKDIETLKRSVISLSTGCTMKTVELQDIAEGEKLSSVNKHDYVVLGGTFDRLHNGHKILLSQAALRTKKLLTVGVTDVNMIQSKKLFELIEPVEQRVQSVLDFLTDINPGIDYNVLPIQDMYGPTKEDPRFQLIVVSEETVVGADKVNQKRMENGLPPLEKFIVELAPEERRSSEEEAKVSSSNRRMRLLGTTLNPPKDNMDIPTWPYVIGLAGGIASGKSNIAERLREKGAAIVNCDTIAHDLYKPGLPLNGTIADTFGADVITDRGEVDRLKLGQIVFSDQAQLERLNALVWPAVIEEAQSRIRTLGRAGHRVVVMEAAVMVRARWFRYCHQLWSVIVPPEEAVKRIQNRNGLSEEEARQRIASQPSNVEQVAYANVVFSPYWSYEYTQSQIDRAWEELQALLKDRA